MCDVTYAMLAISAFGTYVNYEAQKDAAEAQRQMIDSGVDMDQAATNRVYEQINEAAQDDKQQRYTEYLADKARIMSIQAESGLSGANNDKALQKSEDMADTDMATIERNAQRKLNNANSQALSNANKARVQKSGIRNPSAAYSGLQIAGYAVEAYDHYKNPKPAKTT